MPVYRALWSMRDTLFSCHICSDVGQTLSPSLITVILVLCDSIKIKVMFIVPRAGCLRAPDRQLVWKAAFRLELVDEPGKDEMRLSPWLASVLWLLISALTLLVGIQSVKNTNCHLSPKAFLWKKWKTKTMGEPSNLSSSGKQSLNINGCWLFCPGELGCLHKMANCGMRQKCSRSTLSSTTTSLPQQRPLQK